ncbi:patatin-like phospholipase family protein, partial [Rhodopseudomonas sp. HC1]|uniref:patatin-like phospholipase family protein n=1 Tax=Rhodopseudomonas infernalis TaxID=2897386 RepID=UPI001EE969C7
MLAAEDAFLWPEQTPAYRAGLALSGGGVRAATVALGVLESLASRGLLTRIHYISTVSGGGYIGTALSWFWSQRRVEQEMALAKDPKGFLPRFGADATSFPFQSRTDNATPLQQAATANLAFLRQHGSYLTSGDNIGLAGLIMAVVRTVLLSLAVWLPLLVAIFLGIELLDNALTNPRSLEEDCLKRQGMALLNCRPTYRALLAGPAAVGLLIFTVTILFAFLSRLQGTRKWSTQLGAVAIVVAATTHIWWKLPGLDEVHPAMGAQLIVEGLVAAGALLVAIAQAFRSANWSYFLRRTFERASSWIIPPAVGAAFLGAMPLIIAGLKPYTDAQGWLVSLGSVGTLLSLLSGVGTALYGYYLKAKSQLPSVAGQFLAITGSLLFLAGLFLLSFLAAHVLVQKQPLTSLTIAVSLFVVALAIGALGSLNATGLHRFYRDRLMETFMPMTDAIAKGSARESDVADTLTIVDVVRSAEERGDRPYHLVNAHAILVNEPDPKVALRGGDNFLISPAIVGSATTGWMRSRDYLRLQGPLTLASAMAASGAAANANAGYIGTGVTRDRFLSAVMSILNIRLGLWVTNPWKLAQNRLPFSPRVPTYFRPGLTSGILGFGHHHKATFLELSDGGHFENLGLYELVRRRLD